jgi:hypothetical protein
MPSESEQQLCAWIAEDPWRMGCLAALAALALPDAWIGAGFVCDLAWDRLHGFAAATPLADVDVLIFDPQVGEAEEREIQTLLGTQGPQAPWSVRNQARMHRRNGDSPYHDTSEAMVHWLETATAVAVRLDEKGILHLLAPFGLDDLFALTVRPTPHARFRRDRLTAYRHRLGEKAWDRTWPGLRIEAG